MSKNQHINPGDILENRYTQVHRELQPHIALGAASSVIYVDDKGIAVEKFNIGNEIDLSLTRAIDKLKQPGIKLERGK